VIEKFYAIEVSGVCNMACSYCPYRLQQRKRGLMDMETVERVCKLIETREVGASVPLFLHLFGEPMLHPKFMEIAEKFKAVWPWISFSTNGTGMNYRTAHELKEIGFQWITVSPHDPERAWKAFYILKAAGNNVRMHGGPDHNWAGQVDHLVKWKAPCEFEAENKVVVRWNGDIAVCCITDSGEGVIGSIWDQDLREKELPEIELCKTCHLRRRGK